jgi:hypothetical protein
MGEMSAYVSTGLTDVCIRVGERLERPRVGFIKIREVDRNLKLSFALAQCNFFSLSAADERFSLIAPEGIFNAFSTHFGTSFSVDSAFWRVSHIDACLSV